MEYSVHDIMVPISEYATVPEGVTLFEAVMALEKAQAQFDNSLYRHRAVLILDRQNRVVGKLSQLDVLHALEPKTEDSEHLRDLARYGFGKPFLAKVREKNRRKSVSLTEFCYGPANEPVEKFMQAPSEGEYIQEDASLEAAIYQLSLGKHLSLLVSRGEEIVGVLRLSDVFGAICHMMKVCDIQRKK